MFLSWHYFLWIFQTALSYVLCPNFQAFLSKAVFTRRTPPATSVSGPGYRFPLVIIPLTDFCIVNRTKWGQLFVCISDLAWMTTSLLFRVYNLYTINKIWESRVRRDLTIYTYFFLQTNLSSSCIQMWFDLVKGDSWAPQSSPSSHIRPVSDIKPPYAVGIDGGCSARLWDLGLFTLQRNMWLNGL